MSLFPINWFDALLVGVIIFGVYRGKKTGALPQIFGFCQWTLMLVICSFLYAAPIRWLSKPCHMQPDVMGLIIYPIELAGVGSVLLFIRFLIERKVEKREAFGRCENYVAMLAGAARFFVILLTAMAWLSGCYVTENDLRDYKKSIDDNFGGIGLPAISMIHDDVFHGSFSGRFAKEYLKPVLMEAAPRIDYGDQEPAVARKVRLKGGDLGNDMTNINIVEPTNSLKKPQAAKIGPKEIIYTNLTLHGVLITSKKRLALINDQTLREGESADVKMEDKKIKLHCFKIVEGFARVQVEGKTNAITLKINVMTDLNGEPVPTPTNAPTSKLVPTPKPIPTPKN